MLEEALRDPNKNPAEVAQAMLSFVRSDLPNGGTSSEERFFGLFSLLCSRVFGPMQGEKEGFKHEVGGWLSAQNQWRPVNASIQQRQTPYGGSRTVAGNRASTSIDADPVVQLLGPTPKKPLSSTSGTIEDKENHPRSLIEAIVEEAESRPGVLYSFPFLALPQHSQQQFLAVLDGILSGGQNTPLSQSHVTMTYSNQQKQTYMSHNSERLFGKLLQVRPEGQNQVRVYQQKKLQHRDHNQPLQLSPGLTPPKMKMAPTPPESSTPKNQEKEDTPNLLVSMLEYYLFLFLRYPLACPSIQRQPQSQAHIGAYQISGTVQRGRADPAYGERIYFNLFVRYLRHFLPHSNELEAEFKHMESEFFLRALIAFWLESLGSVPKTEDALRAIKERYLISGIQQEPSVDLSMSYDLAFTKYDPPPTMIQKLLRSLVIHLVTDPSIYRSVKDTGSGSRKTCLNPGMTALQQPLFNFVRTTFRHASIHSQGSVFYTAMNIWLIWLEPWNVQHDKKKAFSQNATQLISSISGSTSQNASAPGLTIPSVDRKSMYDTSWEPYLAANLFLYTVPLAIFLRRARELDFSPKEFNRSMNIVKRVFRVYTPEIINALNNLTESTQHTGPSTTHLSQMVTHHRKNLNEHDPCTTQGNLKISSCQSDMQGLLEEVYMQHAKGVRDLGSLDKFAAFFEGLFGQGVVSREEKSIQYMLERAKVIVSLPVDFEVFLGDAMMDRAGKNDSANLESSALRNADGELTDQGRRQLLSGQYKCSPTEVSYVGDSMYARLKSHEIAFLVPLTIALSNWVNDKCGFTQGSSKVPEGVKGSDTLAKRLSSKLHFRFNFRFLSDYRNLLFILLTGWLIKKWIFA